MRIMFAVPSFWPSQDGVANITGYLAQGLAERGHEVLVLTSAGKGGLQKLPEEEEHNQISIVRMRIDVRWPLVLRGRDRKSTRKTYYRQILDYHPDVLIVVCAQTWTLDWVIPYLDKLDCKKIFYSHGYSLWQEKYSYAEPLKNRNIFGVWSVYRCKKYYDRLYRVIRKFDRAVYLSEQNNSNVYAKRHGLTNGMILENAIEDVFFDQTMQCGKQNKDNWIQYLFVANYSENKNQEMLLKAYGMAKTGRSRLALIGFEENPYYERLQQIAKEVLCGQKDKEIKLYTHLSREQVIEQYRMSDVFVCSSKSETWSIVAHEAAAASLPIISTDVGIFGDIPSVCIVHDEQEMRAAMEYLHDHEEERARRGKAAYEWVIQKNCRTEDKVSCLETVIMSFFQMC